ncbi:LCP family protein [Patulibacter sp.]|uniref:LCP family protein n=1 Tax=Patulibacter sp. TaxID=1912859 RepID=UPI00271775E3|nr:LCP family protein [Patulibacter sp.]MDO9409223.1 LCP family protein [Patulibacter sp.]
MQGPQDDAGGGRPEQDDQPYTVYGGRGGGRAPKAPRGGGGRPSPRPAESREPDDAPARPRASEHDADGPGYTVYEARRRGRDEGDDQQAPRRRRFGRPRRGVRRSTPRRVLRWAVTAVAAWVVLSIVLFVVSATVHQQGGNVGALLGGGAPPFTPTNVLILGTDDRPPGSKEPGSEGGSARTDTMLLMRTGGFANAKLSIPRDTAVDVPGHGRQKINAAYAFDGIRGSVGSVENLTGIDVNHVATIDFENFPGLIDAMGGVNYTPKTCLTADVSGGANRPRAGVTIGYDKKLGGTSFRLKKGEKYKLRGSAALALARVRKNRCDPGQDDVDRAGRQQEVIGAMKRRILSPAGFMRLPLIAWKAPQAVKTDMSGFTLLGVAIGQFLPGSGGSHVLKPTGVESIPGGGQALSVSPEAVERARRRYEK